MSIRGRRVIMGGSEGSLRGAPLPRPMSEMGEGGGWAARLRVYKADIICCRCEWGEWWGRLHVVKGWS